MSEWNFLSAQELLPDRPFTNPEHTWSDARAIAFALNWQHTLSHMAAPNTCASVQQTHWLEAGGRTHRLILCDPAGLYAAPVLTLVGFFGQRRMDADRTLLNQIDNELIGELKEHPGLLSYCSLHMENCDYGNIVLFSSEEAKLHWATSNRHAYAVRVVSPKVYETVRLHNGYVPGGLLASTDPVIESTKYLDYRAMLPWRGMRLFGSPPTVHEQQCKQ